MRLRFRFALTAIAALAAPSVAYADPITVVVALQPFIGGTFAAFIASNLATIGLTLLTAGISIAKRNSVRRQQAAAKARWRDSLQDRNVTGATSEPPYRAIYGRAETGGSLVDVLTSDKPYKKKFGNISLNMPKPDAYKHLVIVWSHRQCREIHDIKIDGELVGPLDADGWATSAAWRASNPENQQTQEEPGTARNATVPDGAHVISVVLAVKGEASSSGIVDKGGMSGWIQVGSTLTLPSLVTVSGFLVTPSADDVWEISYLAKNSSAVSAVRVSHHMGAPDQAVDAYLHSVLPEYWTVDHRLRGRCYSVITLDLDRPQFQGGPPNVTADISGAMVFDPRDGTTGWSDNPALCQADWLRSELGLDVPASGIDWDTVIASANACDEEIDFQVGDDVTPGKRYTLNGVIASDVDRDSARLQLCEAMAGQSHCEGKWRILAGVWTPPVMDLSDADLYGSIDILQMGEPSASLFNGMRGQYIPAGSGVPADYEAYSNLDFVAADRGKKLWRSDGGDLPFTNSSARCKNLARIATERCRNGLVIFFPAKMRAWPLQVGDRVRVTSREYGYELKTFRVEEWSFGLRAPVGLVLQEDAAEAWDEADAVAPDPTPNTTLPDPYTVPAVTIESIESGTDSLILQADGSIVSRVHVTWSWPTAAYLDGGYIEVAWRTVLSSTWNYMNVAPTETDAYIGGVQDGTVVDVAVTVVNTLKARSPTARANVLVLGKIEPPAPIQGLAAERVLGALVFTRVENRDADWANTAYEYSTNGGLSYLPVNAIATRRGGTWTAPVVGSLRIRARDLDSSGNAGDPVTVDVTVAPDDIGGASSTLAIKINTAEFAGATNYNEAYIHGFDAAGAPADVAGSIRVNGVAVTVPKGAMYGGQGPVSCVIVWDNGGPGFSTTIPAVRPYVIARKYNGQWQYDNNSAWTAFTPTPTHYVIGQIEVGGVDTGSPGTPPGIVVATMLSDAQLLSSIPGDSVLLNPGDALNSDPYCLDSSKWEGLGDVQRLDNANSPGSKGNSYLLWSGPGLRGVFAKELIPVDPVSRAYNYSANLLASSGNNRPMYLVIRPFRADGREYISGDLGGLSWGGYWGGYTYGGVPTSDGTFRIYGAEFGAGTARPLPADFAYIRIGLLMQEGGSGSSSVTQAAQYIRLTDITAARAASTAAAAAQTAANNAQSSANSALGTLSAMRSNGVLDASEKPAIIKEWLQISGERAGIEAQALAFGIFTERNTYTAAHDNVSAYLSALSPPYNDTTTDTLIIPANDQAVWTSFYNARQALLNKIADAAGKVANWTGVSNRPLVYEQDGDPAVSPGGVVDGSLWRVLTGVNANRWYQRAAGTWRPYVAPETVGTGELANEAATALRSSTNSSAINLLSDASAGFTLNSLTYAAPVDCTVALRLNGVIEHFSGYGHPSGISSAFGSNAQITTDGSYLPTGNAGTGDTTMSYNAASVDPYANVPIYLEKRFTMTAGQSLTFFARARVGGITNGSGGSVPGAVCNVRAGNVLLLEVIKK